MAEKRKNWLREFMSKPLTEREWRIVNKVWKDTRKEEIKLRDAASR